MRFKKSIFLTITILMILATPLLITEGVLRLVEPKIIIEGKLHWEKDDVLGWLPLEGQAVEKTPEFKAIFKVNSYGMNDQEPERSISSSKLKIMALGDSHTFACGVSQDEAWPNVLERALFKNNIESGTVYNCAVVGYNLGQYLLRFRQLADFLKPKIVIIGFSIATDLYDLIPPRMGGFVYGDKYGRVYFDLDNKGNLIEVRKLSGLTGKNLLKQMSSKYVFSIRIKNLLREFRLYWRFRRSKLAMWVALYVRPGGQSLWPGLDTALKKNLNKTDIYRWQLAEKIIKKIAQEAKEKNIKVVLVNIPYLVQVYDDIWKYSYGLKPEKYDRYIAGERLKEICRGAGIYYVDVTPSFIKEVKSRNIWLNYRQDGHANKEGNRIIAEVVLNSLKENNLIYN